MNINGKHYRTIWLKEDNNSVVQIIDQRWLPHKFVIEDLKTVDDFENAIKNMHLRGAGLIGAAAGYGMYIATLNAPKYGFERYIKKSAEKLKKTRPTAINLSFAVKKQLKNISNACSNNDKIIKIHRKLLPASKDAGLTEFSFDSGFLGCQKCSSSY